MKTKSTATLFASIALAASVLGACSSDETSTPTPRAAPTPTAQQAAAKPADPMAKMARAVVTTKSGAAIELKYDVLSKPVTREPIEIDLAIVTGAIIDSMTVAVTATPGLEIVSKSTAAFGAMKAGEIANQKVTVRADRADVVYLTVTATVFSVGTSTARAFAIPLMVSDPAAPAATTAAHGATDAQAKPDATGQKIESLPAKESK